MLVLKIKENRNSTKLESIVFVKTKKKEGMMANGRATIREDGEILTTDERGEGYDGAGKSMGRLQP